MKRTITLFVSICTLIIFAIVLSPSKDVTSRDIEKNEVATREDVAYCAPNSPTGLHMECWQELKVEEWLLEWYATNSGTADCVTLGFAQCFLMANGYGGRTCDTIASDTCGAFETEMAYTSYQQFYALWNIYALHQLFYDFRLALLDGQSLAAATIGKIVLTLNPPPGPKKNLNIFLLIAIMLTFSLALFAVQKEYIKLPDDKAAFLAMMAVLNLGPGLENFFDPLPTGGTAAQISTIFDISDKLSDTVAFLEGYLENIIHNTQGNLTQFLFLTRPGMFSQRVVSTLPNESDSLYHSLQVWVVSQAMQQQNIYVTKYPNHDPRNFTKLDNQVDCQTMDEYDHCGSFWYDKRRNNTWSFHNNQDPGNTHSDLFLQIIREGWATPEELFVDSEGCGGRDASINTDLPALTCISSFSVCTYYEPKWWGNRTYFPQQFIDCPNSPRWGWDFDNDFALQDGPDRHPQNSRPN